MRVLSPKKDHSLIVVVLFLGLIIPLVARAHPHNWIDVWVEVRFDDGGHATGLYQRWLFDDYYSVYVTDGMDGDGDGMPDRARLDELLALMLGNIKKQNYFTRAEQKGQDISLGTANQGGMMMRGHRLEISFFLPFASPLELHDAPLTYRVFDPTYYVEMLHAEGGDAIVLAAAPDACKYRLKRPTPDPEKVAYAATIPADKSGGNDLGKFFAEKVIIECSSAP